MIPLTCNHYIQQFYHAVNLFNHAPVLQTTEDDGVILAPLVALPEYVLHRWGEVIGFEKHPKDLVGYDEEKYIMKLQVYKWKISYQLSLMFHCTQRMKTKSTLASPYPSFLV